MGTGADNKIMSKGVVTKAICHAFGTGYCWSASNPYYAGHYRTKKEAVEAASKIKAKRKKREAA